MQMQKDMFGLFNEDSVKLKNEESLSPRKMIQKEVRN